MSQNSDKNAPVVLSFPQPKKGLGYSGERFTTEMTGPIEQEHRHRYLFAAPYCQDKRVLDIASGEGYGSAMLATVAGHVTGVDIDEDAVRHAQDNYGHDKLEYIQGSATAIPMADNSVDVLVSFETIEHFYGHDAFISEIRRVLVPGGLVIMSSPNKEVYSESPENHNEFHVSELTRQEFWDLISINFQNARRYLQKATAASLILPDFNGQSVDFKSYRLVEAGQFEQKSGNLIRDVYSIIIASDEALPEEEGWGILEDEKYVDKLTSIVQYNEHLIAERDKELSEVRDAVSQSDARADQAESRVFETEQRMQSEARAASEALAEQAIQLEELKRQVAWTNAHADKLQQSIEAIHASTSWKVSAPVRGLAGFARHLKGFANSLAALTRRGHRYIAERGIGDAVKGLTSPGKLKSWLSLPSTHATNEATRALRYETYNRSPPVPAPRILKPKVLLIAELSMPQCSKYRVWQKRDHFQSLSIDVEVIEWWRLDEVRKALQTATIAIWYRSPGYPEHLDLIAEARRLGVVTFWEVDDLIFDKEAYLANRNLALLEPELRKSVLAGIPLYRAALGAVEHAIASTRVLGEQMKKAGAERVYVVENCLDGDTLAAAARVRSQRASRAPRDEVRIVYGSGSKAHDADFECAAASIANVLAENANVVLEIIGDLTLPDVLKPYEARIKRSSFVGFAEYLEQLGRADISLAPLEDTLFNNAKSNIKFLEASVLGIPSVCSAVDTFESAIQDGVTGFLARTDADWETALKRLVADANIRERIGQAALEYVLEAYSGETVAAKQVAPIIEGFGKREDDRLRMLTANIFFSPQSFGGATIVAEEVVRELSRLEDTHVSVFTSFGEPSQPEYMLHRYFTKSADAIAIKLPDAASRLMDYSNPRMAKEFLDILDSIQPDVVHLHSIQGLSASIADACIQRGIPFVITLHDAWWICERQFMVNNHSKYCFQEEIDLEVCRNCVPDFPFTVQRRLALKRILDAAALLLAPSEFHRSLYIANGVPADRIRVNKNGVRPPERLPAKPSKKSLRFAHVGGNGPIKGLELIFKAVRDLPNMDYEVKIVDNTLNLGFSSYSDAAGKYPEQVKFVPAYNQETLDEFFEGVDVLLFPSQWKESFGLTVREALLRNVWVIATDAGGAAEDIVDGVNGTIIPLTPEPDYMPLRNAMLDLLDHPEKLDNYENPYRDRIVTFEDQAAELRGILREVAGDVSRPDTGADTSEQGLAAGKEIDAAE